MNEWEKAPLAGPAQAPGATPAWMSAPLAASTPQASPADEEQGLLDQIMGWGDAALGYGASAADGFREGVANLLGMPVDLLNQSPRLLNALPGVEGFGPVSERPFGGAESIDAGLRGATPFSDPIIPDYVPDGTGERIVNRVGQEIGAAIVPAGAALGKAAQVGAQGARQMGGPVGRFVESAAVSPSKFAAKEMTYAGGAGLGAGVGRELASDGDPNTDTSAEVWADLIGAIFGGVGTGLLEAGGRALGDTAALVTGRGTPAVIRDAIAGELAQRAGAPLTREGVPDTTDLARAIESGATRGSDAVPGYRPTTADAAQNPGLASLEYGRQSGPNSGAYTQRRVNNAEAVTDAIEANRPAAAPGAFRSAADAERERVFQGVTADADARVAAAQADFDASMQRLEEARMGRIDAATAAAQDAEVAAGDALLPLNPATSAEARGQTIRAALDEALQGARTVEREAWAGVVGEADPGPLAGAFQQIEDSLTMAERRAVADMGGAIATPGQLAPDPEDLVNQVFGGGASGQADISEITTLRSEFTTAIREARAAGDVNKARIMDRYVSAIDEFLDGIPGAGEALEAARGVSRDLNDRFTRRGAPVADVMATRPSGGPAVPDSNVASKFVQPDEKQASVAEGLLRETGDATEVRGALSDQIRAETKGMTPDQRDAYVAQRQTVLQLFPEVGDDLAKASDAQRGAKAAGDNLRTETRAADQEFRAGSKAAETTRTGVEKQAAADVEAARKPLFDGSGDDPRATVGRYLKYGDERATDAMAGVVNAKDPARAADDLLSFVGDEPQAVEGARAAFWQLMERNAKSTGTTTRLPGGENRWRPAALARFLENPANRAVAERLYRDNPEHLQNIQSIADEMKLVDLSVTAKAPNSSGTPQALTGSNVLPSTETLGAYTFAYKRGQIGLPYIGLRLVSTMARKATLSGKSTQFGQLLDRALLDPEFAALLLKENNPANVAAMSRAAKSWLGVRSAWVDDLLTADENDEDAELMDAIGRNGQ